MILLHITFSIRVFFKYRYSSHIVWILAYVAFIRFNLFKSQFNRLYFVLSLLSIEVSWVLSKSFRYPYDMSMQEYCVCPQYFHKPHWFRENHWYLFSPVALQSLKDLGRLIYKRFLELLRHMEDFLDEWSARRKASTYTGQHNTERRGQTSMPWAGFEPTIKAHASECAATGSA
jgi:hypothetical protein